MLILINPCSNKHSFSKCYINLMHEFLFSSLDYEGITLGSTLKAKNLLLEEKIFPSRLDLYR